MENKLNLPYDILDDLDDFDDETDYVHSHSGSDKESAMKLLGRTVEGILFKNFGVTVKHILADSKVANLYFSSNPGRFSDIGVVLVLSHFDPLNNSIKISLMPEPYYAEFKVGVPLLNITLIDFEKLFETAYDDARHECCLDNFLPKASEIIVDKTLNDSSESNFNRSYEQVCEKKLSHGYVLVLNNNIRVDAPTNNLMTYDRDISGMMKGYLDLSINLDATKSIPATKLENKRLEKRINDLFQLVQDNILIHEFATKLNKNLQQLLIEADDPRILADLPGEHLDLDL